MLPLKHLRISLRSFLVLNGQDRNDSVFFKFGRRRAKRGPSEARSVRTYVWSCNAHDDLKERALETGHSTTRATTTCGRIVAITGVLTSLSGARRGATPCLDALLDDRVSHGSSNNYTFTTPPFTRTAKLAALSIFIGSGLPSLASPARWVVCQFGLACGRRLDAQNGVPFNHGLTT